MRLGELDQRLVPRLAAGLRTLLDRSGERRAAAVEAARRTASAATDPSRTAPLRRLDDRYASRGPLALVREIPQLGLLLVAAVFLAGSGVALDKSESKRSAARSAGDGATMPLMLGPAPGTRVDAYLAGTRKRAVEVSRLSPDGTYTALVSFSRYLTPAQAQALLGDMTVSKVLAHVQLPTAEVLTILVNSTLVEDTSITFAAVAKRKLRDRQEFVNLSASITGTSKEEKQFKAFYMDAASTAGKEAAAYAKGCACLFAALVRGRARDLAALPALSGVRAVDIGGGDVDTLQVSPLLPEQTVTVTRPATPAQGNGA